MPHPHPPHDNSAPSSRQHTLAEVFPHLKTQVFRYYVVFGIFAVVALAVVGKLLYLQVFESEKLSSEAKKARQQSSVLYTRGRILDRNGIILAQDRVQYDLYAHPKFFWKIEPHEIAKSLAPILNKSFQEVNQQLQQNYSTITLGKNMDKRVIDRIFKAKITRPAMDSKTNLPLVDDDGQVVMTTHSLPGMDVVKKSVRTYPQGTLGSHVLGYVNDEANLQSGVEATAKSILTRFPEDVPTEVEVDGRGHLISMDLLTSPQVVTVPKAKDVMLTIDARLQFIAERALEKGLEKSKGKRGLAIMMEPKTGEILAMAIRPTYDPENFLKEPDKVLKNWSLSDVYPPGSVFKILTVACGLESGVININSRIQDTGKMRVGGWTITNYDYGRRGAPGSIDLIYLLEHSSNIASAKIALMMNQAEHWDFLYNLGFGQKTHMDLPGESAGILLPKKKWDEATHASLGYGYGLAATPMQVMVAINSLANGGIWVPPHVIQPETSTHGTGMRTGMRTGMNATNPANPSPTQLTEAPPAETTAGNPSDEKADNKPSTQVPHAPTDKRAALPKPKRVFSQKTAETVTRLLAESIARSPSHPANHISGLSVAGKTGTSRKPNDSGIGYSNDLYTSFIGYYPAKNPKVTVLVVVDSPSMAEAWGSTVAAPIFKEIAEESMPVFGLKPATAPPKKKQ